MNVQSRYQSNRDSLITPTTLPSPDEISMMKLVAAVLTLAETVNEHAERIERAINAQPWTRGLE